MKTVIRAPRIIALFLAGSLIAPTVAMTTGCGHSDNTPVASAPNNMDNAPGPSSMSAPPPAKPGLTTKQKVVLLAGAALLFYLYKRDQAQNAANAAGTPSGRPQLYREDAPNSPNRGAIYYRKNDAQHTVVWLQAPAQGVQVPADQVQQYLPNYNSNPNAYQGQVNTNPQASNGAQVQPATQYDPSLSGG